MATQKSIHHLKLISLFFLERINYKEVYLNMAKEAKNLRNKEGLKIYDLLKIFENES